MLWLANASVARALPNPRCAQDVSPKPCASVRAVSGHQRRDEGSEITAVWGAKGGAGASTVSLNLASYLASLGRSVLLLDADLNGGGLPLLAGCVEPVPVAIDSELAVAELSEALLRLRSADSQLKGGGSALGLRSRSASPATTTTASSSPPASADLLSAASMPYNQRPDAHRFGGARSSQHADTGTAKHGKASDAASAALVADVAPGLYMARALVPTDTILQPSELELPAACHGSLLHTLPVDHVVVDLGSYLSAPQRTLILGADRTLAVLTPEPLAVSRLFKQLRTLTQLDALSLCESDAERAALRRLDATTEGPRHWYARLASRDGRLAHALRHRAEDRAWLCVLNMTRARAEMDVGPHIVSVARAALGLRLACVGALDFDDVVRNGAITRRPLLLHNPVARAAKLFERVARVALTAASGESRLLTLPPPPALDRTRESLYDVLELSFEASEEEIRRGHRRLRQAFADESIAGAGAWSSGERSAALLKLDEALKVLTNPALREAYDLSVSPPSRRISLAPRASVQPEALVAAQALVDALSPETIDGPTLRQVREARGLSLQEIAEQTRIRSLFLTAIEEESVAALPARVYVAGFVRQYLSRLGIDEPWAEGALLNRLCPQDGPKPSHRLGASHSGAP